jgi:hypothetical protein
MDDEIDRTDTGRIAFGGSPDREIAQRADDPEALPGDRVPMSTAGDETDVVTRAGKQGAVEATDGAGADETDLQA